MTKRNSNKQCNAMHHYIDRLNIFGFFRIIRSVLTEVPIIFKETFPLYYFFLVLLLALQVSGNE